MLKFKHEQFYKLGKDDFLNKIFDSIPDNSFINKGRCGNGGTYMELYNLNRCSVIVVPNVTITKNKAYPDEREHEKRLFAIHGDVSTAMIKDFLVRIDQAKKIITTPAGLNKLFKVAKELNMDKEIYENWFMLMDEAHSAITETYRDDLIYAFDYFWKFKNKSLISATPYYFSDPKIYELTHHKISITENLGTVNLVNSHNVKATLKAFIQKCVLGDRKIFVFYNSVTDILSLLKAMDPIDCRIFCANDKDGDNMKKLEDYSSLWRQQPKKEEFGKVNFFTTTAFEGWDMNIPNSIMVVATDIYSPHSLVGIDKCVQAVGRARKEENSYYHIYNHRNILSFKSLQEINEYYNMQAKELHKKYAEELAKANESGFKPNYDARIEKYCDNPTKNPTLNTYRIDRIVNEEYNREVYNHKDFISKRWAEFYYKPVHKNSKLKWESIRDIKRKSKSTQLEEDFCSILDFNNTKEMFFLGNSIIDIIERKNPLAYKASKYFTKTEMELLKYNPKKIETEIIKKENDKQKIQLLKLVNLHFTSGLRYTKKYIISKLQKIYKEVELLNKNGEPQKASATHIKDFFDVKECKVKANTGIYENGFQLVRPFFSLKMAS